MTQMKEVHKAEKIVSVQNRIKNFEEEIKNLESLKDSYEQDLNKLKKEIENWTGGQNKEVQLKEVKKEIKGLEI